MRGEPSAGLISGIRLRNMLLENVEGPTIKRGRITDPSRPELRLPVFYDAFP
jgi:hypothetical protein